MIIWRGWGFLAVVYIVICVSLLAGVIGTSLEIEGAPGMLAGVGLVIGGALAAVHGWYLNIIRPRRRATEWELAERPRLEAAADQGTLVVGNVQPRTHDEAEEMIDGVIENGRRVIGQHGPHSVFWIPMEIIGILAAVIGVGVFGFNLFSSVLA